MAFHRSAIVLATRLPMLPEGGDSAVDRQVITDPFSGISFDIGLYRQNRRVTIDVAVAWGFELIKPEHAAILLG